MSSGFISETEIVEARRRRQEEWDKVRTADQPQGEINDNFLGNYSLTMLVKSLSKHNFKLPSPMEVVKSL